MINVAMVNGDSVTLSFTPEMTVTQLKEEIKHKLGHDVNRQRLVYKETALQVYDENEGCMTLADYSIEPNSTIHLLLMLLEIPPKLDHVIFGLQWEYPECWSHDSRIPFKQTSKTKSIDKRKAPYVVADAPTEAVSERSKTYLNASCFVYSRSKFLEVYNSNPEHQAQTSVCRGVISYAGGRMNDQDKLGLHTIQVFLHQLPSSVTDLFFTLSSWDLLSINNYPHLHLTCHDARFPENDICRINLARRSQGGGAVIICRVSRSDKRWSIFDCGIVSDGYANDYGPIKDTISKIISVDG